MDHFLTLAQNSSSGGGGGAAAAGGAIAGLLFLLIYFGLILLVIIGAWKVYAKAGQPGWAAIVPIYNMYVLTKIVGRPWWWLILMIIPIVSIIAAIIIMIDLAKSFGKGTGFGVGLAFLAPIFIPILGFGSAQYQGPAAS